MPSEPGRYPPDETSIADSSEVQPLDDRRYWRPPAQSPDDHGLLWRDGKLISVDADVEPRISLLQRLLGLKRRERYAARIRQLDRAISAFPNAPANYVLRGELHLALKQRTAAATDFKSALALAQTELETSDWGVVAQAMAERALMGLRRAGYDVL